MLEGKVAGVYWQGIGGAVAKAFGAEGARVFVAIAPGAKAERLAAEIRASGGVARELEVDDSTRRRCGSLSTQSSASRGVSTSPST